MSEDGKRLSHRLDRVYGATDVNDLEAAYDGWAESYDSDVNQLGYLIRTVSTGYIGRHLPPDGTILDAGAGTGLIGSYLKPMGYHDLTAIDLSGEMLKRAEARACYQATHRMVLGERLDFDDDSFDHGYAVGVFTEGHAPASAFEELIRVIRPGGYFVFSIRDDVYREQGYEMRMTRLEQQGSWKIIDQSPVFQPYPQAHPDVRTRVFVYQVV
jgi:SAM-dependent methyltransferase